MKINKLHFLLILVCTVVVFQSCAKKEQKQDFELIPKKKMVQILLDIHLLDGTVNIYNSHNEDNIYLSYDYYDSTIFMKYGVNDTIFRSSVKYYTLRSKMKDIYAIVIDSLNTRKAVLQQATKRKTHAETATSSDSK